MLHASRARVQHSFSCTGHRENVAVGIKEYGRLVPGRTHILVSGRFRGIVVLLRTGLRPARRAGPRFFVLRPPLSRERRTFLNSKWTFLPGECCQVLNGASRANRVWIFVVNGLKRSIFEWFIVSIGAFLTTRSRTENEKFISILIENFSKSCNLYILLRFQSDTSYSRSIYSPEKSGGIVKKEDQKSKNSKNRKFKFLSRSRKWRERLCRCSLLSFLSKLLRFQ